MKIDWNKNDYIVILGIDYEENMLEVVYINEDDYDIDDVKYSHIGSTVLWEENPPTCSKCIKNKTSCSKKCYDFKAIHPSKIRAIKRSHESKRQFKLNTWKILFQSEDNTERMTF